MADLAAPILNNLIPALLIAVVTATLTVHLALHRFQAERWWERKAEAYSRIVEALYYIIEYCSARSEEYMDVGRPNSENTDEMLENYRTAYADLRKATGIGAYIISDEVVELLVRLETRPKLKWQESSLVEIFNTEVSTYKIALAQIRRLAKKDLRIS